MQIVKILIVLSLLQASSVAVADLDSGRSENVADQDSQAKHSNSAVFIKGRSTTQIVCLDFVSTGSRMKRLKCKPVSAWRVKGNQLDLMDHIAAVSPSQSSMERSSSRDVLRCSDQWQVDGLNATVDLANVALTQSNSSDSPGLRFDNLVCRGSAYEALGERDSAERDYREALRLALSKFDPFDVRVVDPLSRLGRIRLAAGEAGEAELLLLKAQDITHRNAGIYNIQQKEVVDDLTRALVQQGRSLRADRQQELRLKSARKAYGSTPELVQALHDYAKWNAALQRFSNVRETLEEAISIQEEAYGKNDLRLIETLQLRAHLYTLHPTISTPKAGEKAMRRIVDIYASQDSVDHVDLLNARTALGDWYLQGLKTTKALKHYKKTIRSALEQNIDPKLIEDMFGAPRLIFMDSVKRSVFAPDEAEDFESVGVIRVGYYISSKGKVENPVILKDTVNNSAVANQVINKVSTAVFRPRYVNGKATATFYVEQKFLIDRVGETLVIDKLYSPVLVHTNY